MDPIRESLSQNRTSELIAAQQQLQTNEAIHFCNLLQCQSILQYDNGMRIKQTGSSLVSHNELDGFVIVNSSLKTKIKNNVKETSMKKKHNKFQKPNTKEKSQNGNVNHSAVEISTKLLLQSMSGSPIDLLDSARSQRRSSDTNNKSVNGNKKVEKKEKKRKFEKVSNVGHNKNIGKDWKTTEQIKDSRKSSCRSFSPMEQFRGSEEVQVVKHRQNFLVRIPKFNDPIERNEKNKTQRGEHQKPKQENSERSYSQISQNRKVEPDFNRIYVKSVGNKYMEAILQNCKGIASS